MPPRSKSKLIPGWRPVLACFFPIGVTMCNYCVICSPARKEEKMINLGKIMESNRRRGRIFNGAFGNLVACFGQTFPIQSNFSHSAISIFSSSTSHLFFFFFCRPPGPLAKSQWDDKHTGIQGSIGVYEQCISFDWHGPRLIPISERPPEFQINGHSVHGFLSAKDSFSSIFFQAAMSVLRFCKRRDSDGLV